MSKNYAFSAQKRDGASKGAARALRRDNKIPAVIYGDKQSPLNIAMSAKDINLQYRKGNMFTTLCDLDVEGDKHLVLARDIQLHPVTDNVLHADFLRVTSKTKIAVNVPVNFINEEGSPGLQDRGILNVVRHEVELMCTATAIPEAIDVDLAGKEQGDSVKMSDAKLPDGTTPIIDDRDFTIATIQAPKKAEEVEVSEEEGEEGADAPAEGEGGDASAEGDAKKEE